MKFHITYDSSGHTHNSLVIHEHRIRDWESFSKINSADFPTIFHWFGFFFFFIDSYMLLCFSRVQQQSRSLAKHHPTGKIHIRNLMLINLFYNPWITSTNVSCPFLKIIKKDLHINKYHTAMNKQVHRTNRPNKSHIYHRFHKFPNKNAQSLKGSKGSFTHPVCCYRPRVQSSRSYPGISGYAQ